MSLIWGGYAMDRLEIRKIQPVSIPGLVPMLLGSALILCGAALWHEARKRVSEVVADDSTPHEAPGIGLHRLWLSITLCLTYALGLVGRIDFTLATFLFIVIFKLSFTSRGSLRTNPVRSTLIAIGFAAIASIGISRLFADGFLVRLP